MRTGKAGRWTAGPGSAAASSVGRRRNRLRARTFSQEESTPCSRGVTGEDFEEAPVAEDPASVKSYDLGRQERIVRAETDADAGVDQRTLRPLPAHRACSNPRASQQPGKFGPTRTHRCEVSWKIRPQPGGADEPGTWSRSSRCAGPASVVFDPNPVFLAGTTCSAATAAFANPLEGRDFTATEQQHHPGDAERRVRRIRKRLGTGCMASTFEYLA